MRTVEEVKGKITMMVHARHEQPPEIQKNYDTVIQILRWVLGEDNSAKARLHQKARLEK